METRRAGTVSFGALLLLACIGFTLLGNWQLQRRVWKLDLIARVDARLAAPPTPAPGRALWRGINAADDEYRRICADGTLLNQQETLVQAVTRRGSGSWVVTPLQRDDGTLILINRGFVDAEHLQTDTRPAAGGNRHLCGLLRLSESRGAFLHHNDPLANRWYSRDVSAIATARGLNPGVVAPYFVDADASTDPAQWPIGGLTVVQFRNSHLSYALTWYGLALLTLYGLAQLIKQARRGRVQ